MNDENKDILDSGGFIIPKANKNDNLEDFDYQKVQSVLNRMSAYWATSKGIPRASDPEYSKVRSAFIELSQIKDAPKNIDNELNYISNDYTMQIEDIHKSFKDNNLVLILGAGVSRDNGLPTWSKLLEEISINCFEDIPEEHRKPLFNYLQGQTGSLIYARMIKAEFRTKNKCLEDEISNELYSKVNKDKEQGTLKEIVDFCLYEKFSPRAIITYNYDNLLEFFIEKRGGNSIFEPIVSIGQKTKKIPIYHVHGYLPMEGDIKSIVILNEEEYHRIYADNTDWRNLKQIDIFRECTCLFIGHSLTDPNLRRLLDANTGNENLYAIIMEPNHKGILEHYKKKDKTVFINEAVLTEKKLREYDAESLNVKILWAKNNKELSSMLRQIKKGIKNDG